MIENSKIKLHLGSGTRRFLNGFINIDIRPEVNPDVVYDITKISEIYKEVDTIVAIHVLEHFYFKSLDFVSKTYMDVLKDWYKTLKIGGELYLSVPNFEAVVEHYQKYKDLDVLKAFISGGQKHIFDIHYMNFDYKLLSKSLIEVGFNFVGTYNWRNTEWSHIDSYEQAYLPHMDKENGMLMSLNVKAIK